MKPVNLNRFRKQKARAERRARADENAIKFGLSKSERAVHRAEQDVQTNMLDQKKLDRSNKTD